MLTLPAAFTKPTGAGALGHPLRARAIENQAFVVAADQIGTHPPDNESFGGSQIVDPWGDVLARAPDEECFVAADLDLARQDEVRETLPSLANRVPVGLPLARGGAASDGGHPRAPARVDKRRLILDAAITVFARQGFHHCRVSDVADEAGVAYGLVYHYFDSKEEILNELFLERWQIMLDAIAEIDRRQEVPARDKLYLVASFIIDSYRHEPDLMKVIIVEVTRAANSFGRLHLEKIREAYAGIAEIVEAGPPGRHVQVRTSPPSSRRCASTARSSSCCRAGSSTSCRRPRRSSSAPRAWSWRPSAAGWRPRPRVLPPCLVESRADGERTREAPRVERPAGRSRRPEHDRRQPDRHGDLDPAVRRGSAGLLMEASQTTTESAGAQGTPLGGQSPADAQAAAEHDAFAERPEVFVGAAFAGGLALAGVLRWLGAMTPPGANGADKTLGEIVNEVSEKASLLVREEIELAKSEVTEKAKTLGAGAGVGIGRGHLPGVRRGDVAVLPRLASSTTCSTPAWSGSASRSSPHPASCSARSPACWPRSGSAAGPPTPDLAIEEAKITRETLEHQAIQRDQLERSTERPERDQRLMARACPPTARPSRSARSIEETRRELAFSVNDLRSKVGELTNWRRQLAENREAALVGAAVAGFVIGGGVAATVSLFRRRRGRLTATPARLGLGAARGRRALGGSSARPRGSGRGLMPRRSPLAHGDLDRGRHRDRHQRAEDARAACRRTAPRRSPGTG